MLCFQNMTEGSEPEPDPTHMHTIQDDSPLLLDMLTLDDNDMIPDVTYTVPFRKR